jgi:tetratricopeptide (TPR) repeat protein
MFGSVVPSPKWEVALSRTRSDDFGMPLLEIGVHHDDEAKIGVKRAREHKAKGKRAAAKVCAREALRPLTALLARRASAYFLLGNPEQAVEEHERALERDPSALESLFFVGAIHFDAHGDDVPRLERAAEAWRRFAELTEPSHPRHDVVVRMLPEVERAIQAGGVSKVKPATEPAPSPSHSAADVAGGGAASLPPVSKEMMKAIESTPRGPELDAALAKYVEQGEEALARGDGEAAAQMYRSVMPYQPKNARAQAGMAAAQLLKGAGMAERVLAVAVESDPRAVDLLADRLKQKGNAALARTIWQKLSALAPDYSAKVGLEAKMGNGR